LRDMGADIAQRAAGALPTEDHGRCKRWVQFALTSITIRAALPACRKVFGGSEVPNVRLLKLHANILDTVRLLARRDRLYPFLPGLLAEPERLESRNARDGGITETVRP
jgi:hypothetical protein